MPNTRITYLYRDGANYKTASSAVLAGAAEAAAIAAIRANLDDGRFFIPSQVGLGSLQGQLAAYDGSSENDHPWHELLDIETTTNAPTLSLTMADFTAAAQSANWDEHFSAGAA